MSDERRKRQQARLQQDQPRPGISRNVLIILAIVVVAAGVYYFVWHRSATRLDAFAKCLTAKQSKMYGLSWCPHCLDQKEMFGSSVKYIPYIECGAKNHQEELACVQAGIKNFPTWVFADGSRVEGSKSLEYLSDKTGCALP